MLGTAISGVVLLIFARQVSKVVYIKPIYWVPVMAALTIWSVLAARYYSTMYEDLIMLTIFSILGWYMRRYEFSRPAFLIAFFLAERLEAGLYQMQALYFWEGNYIINPIWGMHPIMTACLILAVGLVGYGTMRDKSLTTYS
jgi:TctA family transporter